jgi:DNA-binding NtrC family response regulator
MRPFPDNTPNGTILVIEDDESTRDWMEFALTKPGRTIVAVEDAEAGMVSILAGPPDAVICDLCLPGMDGMTFLRALRERDQDTPLVICTGTAAYSEALLGATELGVVSFLRKPIRVQDLRRAVDRAVALSTRLRALKRGIADLALVAPPPPSPPRSAGAVLPFSHPNRKKGA